MSRLTIYRVETKIYSMIWFNPIRVRSNVDLYIGKGRIANQEDIEASKVGERYETNRSY